MSCSLDNAITPCNFWAGGFISETEALYAEWDDTMRGIYATPPNELPAVIEQLQAIKRNADELEAPECAADSKRALLLMMEAGISAFQKVAAQEPKEQIDESLDVYQMRGREFYDLFFRSLKGEPLAL